MQPPSMPDDGHTTRVTTGVDASSSSAGKESSGLEPVWDDEDTRAFYESLPDLRFTLLCISKLICFSLVLITMFQTCTPAAKHMHNRLTNKQIVQFLNLFRW